MRGGRQISGSERGPHIPTKLFEEEDMSFPRVILAILVFATMISVSSAAAASCSNTTLKGVFGSLDAGFNGAQPEATLTQFTADGSGHLTNGTAINSLNGSITSGTFIGTYSIAKDCTGNYTVTFQGGSTASGNFFLDNMKKGAETIRTDGGFTKFGVILAQGAGVCGLTGKKQTFALGLFGAAGGPAAAAGQVVFNGAGMVSGKATYSLNGTIVSGSLSGTYTENSSCTGGAKITLSGVTTNYDFVVVNSGKEILLIQADPGTTVSGTMQQ